jgi:Immunity protein 8
MDIWIFWIDMKRAELKSWHSPDIEDPKNYIPENPSNFCFGFTAIVGCRGEDGEESFDMQVCTPQWLISSYSEDEILILRHVIIVFRYDFDRILNRIRDAIESCVGKDWNEIAEKVGRIGRWEFEDYESEL